MKRLSIWSSSLGLAVPVARAGTLPGSRGAGGWASPELQLGLELLLVAAVLGLIVYLRRTLVRRTRELRASEERFRRLFENAVEGIYENEPGGRFRLANPAMARILGYTSAAELMALPSEQVAACYVSPTRHAEFFALLDGPQRDLVTDFESEVRRRDGSMIWISENVRAVRDATGRLLYVQGQVTDVTARKRAERALRESEQGYRRLFLANPYPMWIYDRETLRFLAVNDATVALYGYTPEEFARMTLPDIRPDDERGHLASAVRAMHAGPNQLGVFIHRCKDGRLLQVEITTLVFTDQGREQVLAIAKDLTEREQAQAALRESESRYRVLFENSPIGIVEYDYRSTIAWMEGLRGAGVTDLAAWADTHPGEMAAAMSALPIVGVNLAALRLVGAKNFEEVRANLPRIISPAGWTVRRRSFLAVWEGRNESEGELELFALDGSKHHVHAHWWLPLLDGRPFYERTPIALLDLTQAKVAELELAAERERLAVTLSAMAEGVVTTDAAGQVRFINKAACVITGWTAAAATGRRIDEVCTLRHEKTGAPVMPPVAAALAAGHVVDLLPQTTLLRRVGGRGLVEGCCAPIRDAAGRGTGAVLVLRDVTERSRLEAELQRASKLESVGILAGGIAHDFNNILAIVMGNLTLAQLDAGTGAAALRWLKEAERGTLRARDLTQQLLTFAKGGDPVRTAVLLPEIVREAAKFALHGSTVRGEFEIADDLWAAEVDGGQISQVIQNLVINAVQAMRGGGSLRITLHNEELSADPPAPLAAGRYLRLSIADTGTGIRPEHLARIFDPYFTTKEHGSGIGLATVYSIIRKHQGHVTVESELGKGTTFHLWLPAAKEAPAAVAVSRSPFELMQGRILFMDDEEPIRQMVTVLLGRLGLTVKTVADGAELVREFGAARAGGQPYDLVMMDLTVPGGMGGQEAMRQLREIDPNVRAVVSSGYSGDPVLANFREHGFCGIVPKPYRVADLAKVLQAALTAK